MLLLSEFSKIIKNRFTLYDNYTTKTVVYSHISARKRHDNSNFYFDCNLANRIG